jgi:hypothetical protein
MGHYTEFKGRLEFTRRLTRAELAWVRKVLEAGEFDRKDAEIDDDIERLVRGERDASGGGPVIYYGPAMEEYRARRRGFLIGPNMSVSDAGDLIITKDKRGLEYSSEKSYEMVEGVNFIIANARQRIPDFGLKGQLRAITDFEPYHWYLRIGEDGWAHQVKSTKADFATEKAAKQPTRNNIFRRLFSGIIYRR